MKLLLLALIGLAAFIPGCGKKKSSAEPSCYFEQNSYGQRVSWTKLPVTLYTDSSLDSEQVETFKKAIEIWNTTFQLKSKGPKPFMYGGHLSSLAGINEDGKNVVSATKQWVSASVEQAETMLRWLGADLYEADIRLNANKNFSTGIDAPEAEEIDLLALFVHELGHVLGLEHIESKRYTVMSEYLESGDSDRRAIGAIELDALKCEY